MFTSKEYELLGNEISSIRKNTIPTESIQTLLKFKKHGIATRVSLTFGYNGENNATVRDTYNFLNSCKPDAIAFYQLKVYPGTKLYEKAVKNGYINDSWWFNNVIDAPIYNQHLSDDNFTKAKESIINNLKGQIIFSKYMFRDDGEIKVKW